MIELASRTAVETALEFIDKKNKEAIKSRNDKRLHNTRLLLRNYNLLKSHCQKSVYKLSQAVEGINAIDILDALHKLQDDKYIESIKSSVIRTHVVLTHVEEMLDLYGIYCERSPKPEDQRKCRVIKAFYVDSIKMSVIADQEGVDERTLAVRQWAAKSFSSRKRLNPLSN
jgi:hypothetical protein